MSEYQNFPLDFTNRTLELVKEYKGDYEATLLVNCLLGLLVAPNEFDEIKETLKKEKSNPEKWKPFIDCVENWGTYTKKGKQNPRPKTLMSFIRSIRNSLAHFNFQPIHEKERVEGFVFRDNGFKASLRNGMIEQLAKDLVPIAETAFRNNIKMDEIDYEAHKQIRHQTPVAFSESSKKFS